MFNGAPAPILYASSGQAAAIAPWHRWLDNRAGRGRLHKRRVNRVERLGGVLCAVVFSLNGTGAGRVAAVNSDGTVNGPTHPVSLGGYISLFATGEGQTSPSGVDGKLAPISPPYPQPLLPVSVTVDGLPATVAYAGAAPGEVAGLMQVVVQIPQGVQPGGYVPVVLKVGTSSSVSGAAWIAVSGN